MQVWNLPCTDLCSTQWENYVGKHYSNYTPDDEVMINALRFYHLIWSMMFLISVTCHMLFSI
jgi:hypothetical protein